MNEVTVAYREPRPWWSVALASTLARAVGAAIVLGVVAFLAFLVWGVLDSGESDEVPQGRLEEVLQAITSAVAREGQLLHTSVSVEQQGAEQSSTMEMWVDGEQGAIRHHVTPVRSEGSDGTASETTVIIADGYVYVRDSAGAATREEADDCPAVEPWLAAFIACEKDSELRVEDEIWEGEPAIVLVSERSVVIPTPEPNLVTPRATEQAKLISTPRAGVPTEVYYRGIRTFVSRLYLDHVTYLPIALTWQNTRNGEPENEFGDAQLIYEHEFLPRTDDLLALFDPWSIGYSGEE